MMRTRQLQPGNPAPWLWALVGCLLGLMLATGLFAPAAWLGYALARASNGHVVLNDAQGSVWQGSAQLVLSGGTGSRDATTLPGRIHWRLRPRLPMNMQASLKADCCIAQEIGILITPHLNGATAVMQASQSTWPATLLAGLGAPFNTIDLQATLKLNTQVITLQWRDQQLKLDGLAELDALDASTRLSTLHPVGSYRVRLQGGATPTLNLQTLNGSLQLSGTGQFIANRWRFNGEASSAPGAEAALSNFLDIVGRRVGPRSIITLG
jgi:general secretion pathway protein N